MDQVADDGTPDSVEALRARVLERADGMPKRLRQCAEFILREPERIAVSTVAEVAAGAGVQPSAVIRFCQAVGLSGFSDMQRLFRRDYAGRWPDYATRLEGLRLSDGGAARLLHDFAGAGHKSLSLLVETLDPGVLDRAVGHLAAAGAIHVIGLRRAFPAAAYLAYLFEKMGTPCVLHAAHAGLTQGSALREGDALLAITFAPYSEETVALARAAAERGLSLVGITDGPSSPLRGLPGEMLTVREVDVGDFRSLAATLSLVVALAVAVGAARGRTS